MGYRTEEYTSKKKSQRDVIFIEKRDVVFIETYGIYKLQSSIGATYIAPMELPKCYAIFAINIVLRWSIELKYCFFGANALYFTPLKKQSIPSPHALLKPEIVQYLPFLKVRQ